jgi:PPP family 3-phenylpropionic acid transporter
MRQSRARAPPRPLPPRAVPGPLPLPYRRLASLYFAYFAFVGAFAPYFSLYLQAIGQSAWQIGLLLALMQLARMGAPYFWAWLADRHGWRARLMQGTLAAAIVAYCGVFGATGFAPLIVVLAGFAFFSSATMPLLESITLAALRERIERYGGIRLWGSVGFICAVLGVGWLLDRVAIENLLWMLLVPLAVTLAIAFTLRDLPAPGPAVRETIAPLLRRTEVVVLLGANVMMNIAHGPLYAFYSIYLAEAGYEKVAIGALWSLGVVAEIAVFLAAPRWMNRFASVDILIASFALAVVRFALIGWGVGSPGALVLAQVLHAASFGSCHLASVALVSRWFTGARQVRGQALYTSLAFGLGGFAGAAASGLAWDLLGAPWTFTAASVAAGAGLLLLLTQAKLLRNVAPSTPPPARTSRPAGRQTD